jgi:hypothetical protein
MKLAFSQQLLSCLLCIFISIPLSAQPPQKTDSVKSAFSRMGTHISGFGDFVEENKKVLFKRILLSEEQMSAYLAQRLQSLPEESHLHLSEEKQYALTYIPASLFEDLLEVNPATPATKYRLAGTRFCHALKDGRYAFELYNGDALMVEGINEAKALQKLQPVQGAAGTTHWKMPLTTAQTEAFLADGPELWEESHIDSGKIYTLTTEEILFVPSPEEAGILFSDQVSLLTHLDMLSFYESEASKYLSNQLVDGSILPGLEKRLIFLTEPQLRQVILRHECRASMKHQDSARQILRLGGGGYLMWHIDHHYARYFTQEVDLENYLSTGDYDNQPEMLFDAVIRQYGDSLVNHADELVLHLHASSIIEKEKLDYSLESLEELAVALSWQQKAIYSEDLALAMLAYTGEVLKRVKRGKWAQVKEEQTQMSLPVIQSSKDQTDNVREWALKYWPVQ